MLCTCSAKKVQWYLQRGLAVAVPSSGSSGVADCSEPLSVQLLFEPLGRGHADDKYYLVSVCGGEGACYCHCWAGIGTLFVLCVLGRGPATATAGYLVCLVCVGEERGGRGELVACYRHASAPPLLEVHIRSMKRKAAATATPTATACANAATAPAPFEWKATAAATARGPV